MFNAFDKKHINTVLHFFSAHSITVTLFKWFFPVQIEIILFYMFYVTLMQINIFLTKKGVSSALMNYIFVDLSLYILNYYQNLNIYSFTRFIFLYLNGTLFQIKTILEVIKKYI